MRNILLVVLSVLLTLGCSASDDVVLSFHVEGPSASEVVIVCHDDVLTYALDSEGNAEAVLSGYDAAYARVFYGMDHKWIYFERGDEAEISFDGKDFAATFEFVGKKAPAVDYLNRIRLTPLPDEDYALPFDEYCAKMQAKVDDAVKLLDANGLSSVGRFVEMEKDRIRYAYATTLLMHPIGHKVMTADMSYEPDKAYYEVIDSYLQDMSHLADLDEFRDFAVEAAHVLDAENRDVRSLYPKTVAQMKFISDRFDDEKLRCTLLHYLASSYVDRFGIEDIQELENVYYTYVKDETMLAEYAAKYEKWNRSRPGKPSPDFSAVDVDGKVWTLEDFKGKYVYIDMWATWCAPCKRELPYMKELEKKFEGAEIVFLGLSTDGDKKKWEDVVRSGVLSGVQLHLGPQSDFQKAYKVEGIPRFILLDKEGLIISNDMPRPSSEETAATLEALDGIRR